MRALFDSMTIAENVAFPLRQQGGAGGHVEKRLILDRLAEVGLPDVVFYKRPAQLSGGMRKRVGLARALILEPDPCSLRRTHHRSRSNYERRYQ